MQAGLKAAAEIRPLLVPHGLFDGFMAIVMASRGIKLAVSATVQICMAEGTFGAAWYGNGIPNIISTFPTHIPIVPL